MDDAAVDELRTTIARLYRRLRAERAHDQLGDTHSTVLLLVAKHGPQTLRELSGFVQVTPPSMSETVNWLVKAGYLIREKDPHDRRKVLFVATREGHALAEETSRRRHVWLSDQLEGLSPSENQSMLKAMRILRRIAYG